MIEALQAANRRAERAVSQQRADMAKALADLRNDEVSLEQQLQVLREAHDATSHNIDGLEQQRCEHLQAMADCESLLASLPIGESAPPPPEALEPEPEEEAC